MCKEKIKENKFLNFLKRNPKSILGIIAGFIASLASGAGTTCGLVFGNVELPLWANICVGVAVCVIEFVLIVLGVNGAGFEGVAKYQVRKIAERLGFGKAMDELEKAESAFQAEEEAKEKAEALALEQAKAKYQEAWKIGIANGSIDVTVSLDDYIAQRKAEEDEKAKEVELKKQEDAEKAEYDKAVAEFRTAVAMGYTGSFDKWRAEQAK